MLEDEEPVKEIIGTVKEEAAKHSLPDHEVVVMVWGSVMGSTEWSKKDDLVAEQALKQLRTYAPLFKVGLYVQTG